MEGLPKDVTCELNSKMSQACEELCEESTDKELLEATRHGFIQEMRKDVSGTGLE